MKNLLFLFVLIGIFSSCKKPDRTKTTPDFFVGKWQWSYSVMYEFETTWDNITTYYFLDTIIPTNKALIHVKKNGNLIIYEDEIKMKTLQSHLIWYSESGKHTSYGTPDSESNYMKGVYSHIFMNSFDKSDTILVLGYPYDGEPGSYFNEIAQQNINTGGVIVYNFFTRK